MGPRRSSRKSRRWRACRGPSRWRPFRRWGALRRGAWRWLSLLSRTLCLFSLLLFPTRLRGALRAPCLHRAGSCVSGAGSAVLLLVLLQKFSGVLPLCQRVSRRLATGSATTASTFLRAKVFAYEVPDRKRREGSRFWLPRLRRRRALGWAKGAYRSLLFAIQEAS